MTAFVDTNVLAYLYDTDEPTKRATSVDVLRAEGSYVVSGQVLGELYVTLARKMRVSAPDATVAIERLARQRVVPISAQLVQAAIATSEDHQLSYWDALIVEAAASAGCDRILTEDLTDGQTIRGVQIVNPFV